MNVITVSQLNTYIRALLDESAPLKNIFISGEISNFIHYAKSGHMYFTLKDSKSQLKCVMFASSAARLRFVPENGMHVICRGRIGVYEKDGAYQLYAEDMQPEGAGALHVAFEQLKARLEKSGMFDDIHKKPIPACPMKIGVATSISGAAVEDIKNIAKRRFPLCELVLSPTVVQGDNAPQSIAKSVERLDCMPDVELIIVGRGGGSAEDLWAFNTETVANAVFACSTPIISAVGHETDYTICDFVADLRAPTPSAAVELALPDAAQQRSKAVLLQQRINTSICRRMQDERQRLDRVTDNPLLSNPSEIIRTKREYLNMLGKAICTATRNKVTDSAKALRSVTDVLNACNPLAVLSRGYAIVEKDGRPLVSKADITAGSWLGVTLSDGRVDIKISEVKEYGR